MPHQTASHLDQLDLHAPASARRPWPPAHGGPHSRGSARDPGVEVAPNPACGGGKRTPTQPDTSRNRPAGAPLRPPVIDGIEERNFLESDPHDREPAVSRRTRRRPIAQKPRRGTYISTDASTQSRADNGPAPSHAPASGVRRSRLPPDQLDGIEELRDFPTRRPLRTEIMSTLNWIRSCPATGRQECAGTFVPTPHSPSRTSMSTWRSGESSTQYGCRATRCCNTRSLHC